MRRASCVRGRSRSCARSSIIALAIRSGSWLRARTRGWSGRATPDDRGDQMLVNLDRLAGIESIDPLDRSAVVLAGTRLSKVNGAAHAHGLHFPIVLGADPSIGGMVATNTGGSRMLRYGDVRANLLGLEVILADVAAPVLSDLMGLRKDNSGLDWKHLFVGTGGTFGVVTRARINLHTLPLRADRPARAGRHSNYCLGSRGRTGRPAACLRRHVEERDARCLPPQSFPPQPVRE